MEVTMHERTSGHIQQAFKTYEQYLEEKGYKLGRTLGTGSYAKVKEAKDYKNGGRKIAVKIIDKNKAPRDFLAKFLPRELEIYSKLNHPNIIKKYDALAIGNKVFMFMEIADGGDLLDYIKRNGALENSKAKRMFYELCQAIKYCHAMNITHRDLKCENILLDRHEHIKLADFGFARHCVDPETGRRILSRTYCGSAAYAAPEILQGNPYNPKLYDVWSLGCILFIMICAAMPYDDRDVKKMLKCQMEKLKYPPKSQERIDPLVKDLISHMLEVDVTKRYNIDKVLKHRWLLEPSLNAVSNSTLSRL